MKHMKRGFTLIEISLFLALTGLLFMGIVVGTGRSVAQQRFFDATQNYAEFLRRIYSQVANPQSAGNGASEMAIYGKMISFGQKVDLAGNDTPGDEQWVYVYDVVGSAEGAISGDAVGSLKGVGASVVTEEKNSLGNTIAVKPAGLVEAYEPKWGATIETTDMKTTEQKRAGNNNLYTGTILVVRHPRSGTINTLVSSAVIDVNRLVRTANNTLTGANIQNAKSALTAVLGYNSTDARAFKTQAVDFCVNPEGVNVAGASRWDIRLVKNARNASGVEVIDLDALSMDSSTSVINRCRVSNWQQVEGI
ncbi:hypothetical protein IKG68_02530 [Candidatus Saccharibacteria bacterium]|nr:hypothetical protein [Candidatus Saccharibacteria bacterium]